MYFRYSDANFIQIYAVQYSHQSESKEVSIFTDRYAQLGLFSTCYTIIFNCGDISSDTKDSSDMKESDSDISHYMIRYHLYTTQLLSFLYYSRPAFYNPLPVYKWTHSQQHFSIEQLGQILLGGIVPEKKICTSQPISVCHNVAVVVNN